MVKEIILKDQDALKQEKISEFEYGIRPDGSIIGNYRSPDYAHMKHLMNPKAGGKVDLILEGHFSSKLFVFPRYERAFLFGSKDEKTSMLEGKYGRDIMGLNPDYFKKRQIEIYKPMLVNKIKEITKIG